MRLLCVDMGKGKPGILDAALASDADVVEL
jgi:hypothetical protein